MDLENFLIKIKRLSSGKSFKPHKFILLLVVLDLIQEKIIKTNKIVYDDVVKDRFTKYIKQYGHEGDRNRPYTPFFHLRSSGFWHLKAKPAREEILKSLTSVGGPNELIENVEYAYLSDSIYGFFTDKVASKKIKEEIIMLLWDYKNSKTRITAYKANSLFLHEEKAIKKIESQAHHIGKFLNNVLIYDNQSNNYFEIDLLLVTNFGIFVIELKHWTGHIKIEPHNWVVNDFSYRADPHKINSFKSQLIKGIYQHRFKFYPNIWVESVVVLTNPDVTVEGAASPGVAVEQRLSNLTFSSIEDFITYLKKRRASTKNQILDDQQVDAIINYFASLDKPKQSFKYIVPGYETVEYISQKPECIELIARPLQGHGKGLYRFRIFRPPQNVPQKEKERFNKKAHNTIQSVAQIGDHPHIHKVWVIQNDLGDIIEGSEWSETGTLRDLMLNNNHVFQAAYALNICYGIARALNEAHKAGVIHRAVKPENILMMNDMPKLMNFDLAYQLEDNRLTVIEDASKLKDDGYIAPDIIFGQDIDESTDFFSLGVIAYELLTGEKPFNSVKQFVAQNGKLNEQKLARLKNAGISQDVVDIIDNLLVADRKSRLVDISEILEVFGKDDHKPEKSMHKSSVVNEKLEPGSSHDIYEIVEYIGGGRESQIYKARTVRGEMVALKFFNKEVPRERIFREAEITSLIDSSYVVRCDNKIGHWNHDRYFIVLQYIQGESLRNIIDSGTKPDLGTFKTVALGLMEAIRAFHYYKDAEGNPSPLLHSDIKPDNVIITRDKRGILIDCGISGEPRIDTFKGTPGYVPPDCLSGTDMSFSEGGDLFALGVTLWEWLFGIKPYENPVIGDTAIIPEDMEDSIPDTIKAWLLKAVATEAESRFSNIEEMHKAFTKTAEDEKPAVEDKTPGIPLTEVISAGPSVQQDALKRIDTESKATSPLLDIINPFVSYLNTLSNDSAGNENATAEAQLINEHYYKIAVDNPLTDFVYDKIMRERCNVILTGNAGDGKTTIAADIFERLSGERRLLNPREFLAEQGVEIIKDMSELDEAVRLAVLKEASSSSEKVYLIISNTGKLLKSFKGLESKGLRLDESELLEALEADSPKKVFKNCFLVLNIARIDSINTACAVFKRMIDFENWNTCTSCAINKDCPIFFNISLLREKFDIVQERVMLLYRRLFEYNVRLTMRQMIGHLAYAITAGRKCQDIMAMSQTALEKELCGSLFSNRFFGDDGVNTSPEAIQLYPVKQLLKEEFGVILDPTFERNIWMNEGTAFAVDAPNNLMEKLHNLFIDSKPANRRQLRRLVYFFGSLNDEAGRHFLGVFLRSPMLLNYIDLLNESRNIARLKESMLRTRILQVMQEYFIGVKLPENRSHADDLYITVKQGIAGSGSQMVLADFRNSDFELVKKPRFTVGTEAKNMLCLRFKQGVAEMELDLPFFDYVWRRYEGDITEELSAFYADRLERFKVRLIEHYYKVKGKEDLYLRLLMIRTDRKFKFMKVVVDEKSLEVL